MSSHFDTHCDHAPLFEDIDSKTFTISQRRWRVAYTAIHFALSLTREIVHEKKTGVNLAQKRWRLAYATIYSSRVMLSLVRDTGPITKSHIALNIGQISPPHIDKYSHDNTLFYGIEVSKIANMAKERDVNELQRLGGVGGLVKTLKTVPEEGICGDDQNFRHRQEVFGTNTYHKPPPKGLIFFVYEAFKDTTILILLVCAALSLGFGIKEDGLKEGWYEGGSIYLAVFLVILVSALSNFRQERQFDKLSKISNNIRIEVSRNGRRQEISIFEIVVGDVVFLTIGDQVPADGVFLKGHSVQVDESSMTGESDYVSVDSGQNPFLLSGSKVADGYCQMIVTSVGMNTRWGEMMSSITQGSNEPTPLQARLDKLTSSIGKLGLLVAFLVLIVLLVRYFTGNTEDESGNQEFTSGKTGINQVLNSIVRIISIAVTIVVVAIPEGLPLAVTLTLAYSMKRMMADQAMVRKLSACETMGSATVICTDKTGTLTMNQMKVTKFFLGNEEISENYSNLNSTKVRELFHEGVGLNTTGTVYKPASGCEPEYSGSPTEKAILKWAVSDLGMDTEKLKRNHTIIHVETFNSEKKRSGVLIRDEADKTVCVHWKGAAEMILSTCSNYIQSDGNVKIIDEEERELFQKIIQGMAASSLRCIAFAHKQIPKITTKNNENLEEKELTLLGVVGLKDPCRPGVKKAIQACRSAGVDIKMITGDNVFTAKAIATECGILKHDLHSNDGEIVEGVEFRNYPFEERLKRVDQIRVMARSSPLDKLLMVQCLKHKGHVVAVTGDGTNDAPALKEADIGLSMGIQGTEVAKDSSDIVILDDDFATVATVLKWGRCVYNNIQKFIQFQLTVNVAALVINFIAAVSSGDVPLTAVQLLWVNLIMDTLGALALATERPTGDLLHKPPVGRLEPLITTIMWRNLLSQALYQIAILLTLQFKGKYIFDVSEGVKNTLIFNTFVLCQVFNEFNSRELEKKNVFKGLLKNRLFVGIVGVTMVLQIVMVEFLKRFADTERLNWWQWVVCVGIAAMTWPIAWVVKSISVPEKFTFSYKFLRHNKNQLKE